MKCENCQDKIKVRTSKQNRALHLYLDLVRLAEIRETLESKWLNEETRKALTLKAEQLSQKIWK